MFSEERFEEWNIYVLFSWRKLVSVETPLFIFEWVQPSLRQVRHVKAQAFCRKLTIGDRIMSFSWNMFFSEQFPGLKRKPRNPASCHWIQPTFLQRRQIALSWIWFRQIFYKVLFYVWEVQHWTQFPSIADGFGAERLQFMFSHWSLAGTFNLTFSSQSKFSKEQKASELDLETHYAASNGFPGEVMQFSDMAFQVRKIW